MSEMDPEKKAEASENKPDASGEKKNYKPIAFRQRHTAKDYSHFAQTYIITLCTDSAQRFLERYYLKCEGSLNYLNYSLFWLRDDDLGKKYLEEIEQNLVNFQKTMTELTQKMRELVASDQGTLLADSAIQTLGDPKYDNPLTYYRDVNNSQSLQLLRCVALMDRFFQELDKAYNKHLIQLFEKNELVKFHVDNLIDIQNRIRNISREVSDKSREIAALRAQKAEEEAHQRELERAKMDRERQKNIELNVDKAPTIQPKKKQDNADPAAATVSIEMPDASAKKSKKEENKPQAEVTISKKSDKKEPDQKDSAPKKPESKPSAKTAKKSTKKKE